MCGRRALVGRGTPGGLKSLQEQASPRREHCREWRQWLHCLSISCPPPPLSPCNLCPLLGVSSRVGSAESHCPGWGKGAQGRSCCPVKGPLLCWSELEHLPVLCYRLPQCVAAYQAGLETATPSPSVTQSKWKMLSGLRAGGPLVPARSWRAGRPVCLGRSPAVVLRPALSLPHPLGWGSTAWFPSHVLSRGPGSPRCLWCGRGDAQF